MKKTHEDPARAVGASDAWQGNDQVGKGKMTITELDPSKQLAIELQFLEPFASVAKTGFDLASAGAGATRVTWSMEGNNDFMGKLFGTFMDVESMIGADYEKRPRPPPRPKPRQRQQQRRPTLRADRSRGR